MRDNQTPPTAPQKAENPIELVAIVGMDFLTNGDLSGSIGLAKDAMSDHRKIQDDPHIAAAAQLAFILADLAIRHAEESHNDLLAEEAAGKTIPASVGTREDREKILKNARKMLKQVASMGKRAATFMKRDRESNIIHFPGKQ